LILSKYLEEKSLTSITKLKICLEMAYVYYIDLYYKHSQECIKKAEKLLDCDEAKKMMAKFYINLALYQSGYFKQRLAFGPYLAIGVILAHIYGEKLIQIYFSFFEKIFINSIK
jgi:hypothetical protein